VLDVFLPEREEPFSNDGKKVTFYPFLVVLEGVEEPGVCYWLPYWHLEDGKRKYGQYAPFLDSYQLEELIQQAIQKGYLRTAHVTSRS
jgi:hypothetical protein